MAAASNKPGAVHYFLIAFVMISVVLGIVSYMNHREFSDQNAKFTEKEAEVSKLNRLVKNSDDQIQVLKKLVGRQFDLVDDPTNPNNANTVKSAALKDMADFGKELVGTNYAETLQRLREALDAALADRDSKAAQVAALQKDLETERNRLNAQLDTANKAKTKSESDKRDVISTQDERLTAKQEELNKLKADNNGLIAELAQEREGRERDNKAKSQEITNLENRIEFLRDKLNEIEKVTFEVPDGLIQRVDNASKSVWINLGEADFLKPRMTFSVYAKESQGVGRGAEDVKGRIEVTRIIGPHMAEARITEEDLFRPMVARDLIYTPLWSPGLVEKISFVGLVDLDGDGKSDWEEMKQILAVHGAEADNYVDDNGNRFPETGKITVHTKFLVLGYIPEPDQVVGDDDKQKVTEINKHRTEMTKEARVNGVRSIKLNDFLAFLGVKLNRRVFRPGQERPFNLKAGANSTAVNEPLGDRSANGNVSGAFGTQRKSAPQMSSDGHTSKLFTGGK